MAFKQFVDISGYQDSSASYFNALRANGACGCFIQLVYGSGYPNKRRRLQAYNSLLKLDWTGCYQFGLGDPVNEAHAFLGYLGQLGMDTSTPVMLDVEPNQSYNGAQTHLVNQWAEIMYKAGYHNIWVYVMASWIDGYHIIPAYLHKYVRLWPAKYGGSEPGVNGASAWQFTSNWHGMNTDGNYLFVPESVMTGHAVKPAPKPKARPRYIADGKQFRVISNGLNGYADDKFHRSNGNYLAKGSVINGSIRKMHGYTRLKTNAGYFSSNARFLKKVR